MHKPHIARTKLYETFQLFLGRRQKPIKHSFDLVRACTNGTVSNDETKILSLSLCKRAILEAEL